MTQLNHWRCFWSWPQGHNYEVIDYFDGVAGRWAAFSLCVRCDKSRGLAVGAPVHGAVFASNPLATGLAQQGTKRSAPPSATSTSGAPREAEGVADVALGKGLRLFVRRARVSSGLRRGRTVYVAHIIGTTDTLRAASPTLRRAVARATSGRVDERAVEAVVRQLEHELG